MAVAVAVAGDGGGGSGSGSGGGSGGGGGGGGGDGGSGTSSQQDQQPATDRRHCVCLSIEIKPAGEAQLFSLADVPVEISDDSFHFQHVICPNQLGVQRNVVACLFVIRLPCFAVPRSILNEIEWILAV